MKKINFSKINIHLFAQLPDHEKKMTLSSMITMVRIVLVPIIVVAMIKGCWGAAFLLFISAALTDMIDGIVARILDEKTFLGASLDVIADKLLILSCFATLAFVKTPLFALPPGFVFFVLIKEIIQVGGAFFLYYLAGYLNVQPTLLGKLTMVVHTNFIIWLFACYFFKWLPVKTYYTMLALVICLVSVSLLQYIIIGYAHYMDTAQRENI
jgi:cardiolipin synthase